MTHVPHLEVILIELLAQRRVSLHQGPPIDSATPHITIQLPLKLLRLHHLHITLRPHMPVLLQRLLTRSF